MGRQNEERRIRGIAKQRGMLKAEIRRKSRRNVMFFLLGISAGLLMNILIELIRF